MSSPHLEEGSNPESEGAFRHQTKKGLTKSSMASEGIEPSSQTSQTFQSPMASSSRMPLEDAVFNVDEETEAVQEETTLQEVLLAAFHQALQERQVDDLYSIPCTSALVHFLAAALRSWQHPDAPPARQDGGLDSKVRPPVLCSA